MMNRFSSLRAFAVLASLVAPAGSAMVLEQNFDGGGLNSPFSLDTAVGGGAVAELLPGGPTGSFARITHTTTSINRSIAFDLATLPSGTTALTLTLDFRLSDDATNNSTGGCCGDAADGIGIGFYPSAIYGTTGQSNPGGEWEQGGHNGALKFGLDIFQANRVLVHNGNAVNGGFLAENTNPGFTLNSNLFHRFVVTLSDAGSGALADVSIIEDVFGTAVNRPILDDVAIADFDLDTFSHRVIVGGRTGGAWHNGDVDNVAMTAVPEPSSAALTLLGMAFLTRRRRSS